MRSFIKIIFMCLYTLSFSQSKSDIPLVAQFTYLLSSKPNKLYPDTIYNELFSLQVSNDRSFYISENRLISDSIYKSRLKSFDLSKSNVIDFKGVNLPKNISSFVVVQESDKTSLYATVKMAKLYYEEDPMTSWRLIDEGKVINTFSCKKAEIRYKGRDWTAWYAPSLSFPYGPHKFGGLPGLIVKLTDSTGDYDYELVKAVASESLQGKFITIDKRHYEKAALVTKSNFKKAREEEMQNIIHNLENMGTVITPEHRKMLRERELKNQADKKGYNPLELED